MPPFSGFVERVARVINGEVSAHCARVTDVIASASDSLDLDSLSIGKLLQAAGRRVPVSKDSLETLGTAPYKPLVPCNKLCAPQACVPAVECIVFSLQTFVLFVKALFFLRHFNDWTSFPPGE